VLAMKFVLRKFASAILSRKFNAPIALVLMGAIALAGISGTIAHYTTAGDLENKWGIQEFRRITSQLSEDNSRQLHSFARSAVRLGYSTNVDDAGVMYTVLEGNLLSVIESIKGPLDVNEITFAISEYALTSDSTFQLVSPYFHGTFSDSQDLVALQYLTEALECEGSKDKSVSAQDVGFNLGQKSWEGEAATFLGTYVGFCRSN